MRSVPPERMLVGTARAVKAAPRIKQPPPAEPVSPEPAWPNVAIKPRGTSTRPGGQGVTIIALAFPAYTNMTTGANAAIIL
jgi:hypothetical protein